MEKKAGATSPEQQSKAALLQRVKSSDIDEVTLSDCVGLFVEVDRAIARKQDTSSAILERLSHHSDKIVRQSVASHHNILSEDLMRLGKQFPDAFLSNPALDLILIENPGLLLNFDESLLVQIAKREACPEAFLKWAIRQGSEQVLMAIAMNPSAPVALLKQLSVSEFNTVKEAVRFHTKLLDGMEVSDIQAHFKQAVIERLSALPLGEAYQMWKRKEISLIHFRYLNVGARLLIASDEDLYSAARNPNTAAWMLAEIAKDDNEYVRKDVAENPNTPSASLTLLAKDDNEYVRVTVAENPNTPSTSLTILAKDKDSWVRSRVASNPNAPEDLLTLFSNDESSSVRSDVTWNPNIPIELLKVLAEDKDEYVRDSIARNPNTPIELLSLLAKDLDKRVRRGVAGNPNTPIESLMTLAEDCSDTNLGVLWNISSNPNTPRELVQKLLPMLSADLERNKGRDFRIESPNAPIELQQQLLSTLAKDRYKRSRLYAAGNLNTPSCSLALLVEDKDKGIRRAVANNPNTPEASLELLAKDKDHMVSHCADLNPSRPITGLMELDENTNEYRRLVHIVASHPNAPEASLTQLAKDKDEMVRASVAANSNCSLSILQTLSIDEDTYVRSEVASNPKTTKAMLEKLVKDKSNKVRSCVAFNPQCPDELLIQLCHDKNISIDAKASAIEKLNFPEDILALPHFNSILQTKAIPEQVFMRLDQHEDSEVRFAALGNPLHPSWIKSLIEAPKTNPLFIKWASKAQQSAQSALESDNVFFFAGKDANKAAVSTSALVRVFAISDGASVEPARLAKSQKHNNWLVRMSIASNIGTPINALNKLKQDSHALVAKQAEMTIAKLSDKPEIELLDEEARQSSFYQLSKDIAVAIKSKHHQTVAIDDPVWGYCINPAVLWDPSRINEVTETWTDAEWQLFGKWMLPVAPGSLSSYLTSEAIEIFLVKYLRRKNKSLEQLASHIVYSETASKIYERDKHFQVRMALLMNPNTPESLLTTLSKDMYDSVRRGVARHPNTSEALLSQLSKDKYPSVRKGVAENPNTTEALITLLSEDKDSGVRQAAVENINPPEFILKQLVKDEENKVSEVLATDPDTSKETLETTSSNKYAFLKSLSLAEYKEHIRIALSPDITLPTEITSLDIRRGIKSLGLLKGKVSHKELTEMRISKDRLQRVAVCFHNKVTESLLAILSEDKDVAVAEIAKEMLATFDEDAAYALLYQT